MLNITNSGLNIPEKHYFFMNFCASDRIFKNTTIFEDTKDRIINNLHIYIAEYKGYSDYIDVDRKDTRININSNF